MPKHKPLVTRKFLLNLAKDIYDPKSRRFLRLCNGTLQNGPDPKDAARPMHCGLGELYFAMTGKQPNEGKVNEQMVIDLAVKLSPFADDLSAEAEQEAAIEGIKKLNLPRDLEASLIYEVESSEDFGGNEDLFRETLDEIPNTNDEDDDTCRLDGECSWESYRNRSMRVARVLREAAMLLPE